MKSFLKIFLASLLALIVFTLIAFFMLIGMAGSLASSDKPAVGTKAGAGSESCRLLPGDRGRKPAV